MFGKNNIDPRQLVPTSKISLKLSCLAACNNDISEAEKLYRYIASDLASLPDMEPNRPTILQQADQIFGWVGQHKDDFMQGWSLIQSLRGGVNPTIPTDVPPIPDA